MDTISVHIVTHNSELYISHCLIAIIHQKFKYYNVLIIDNASSDKTVEIAKRFPFRIIRNKKNLGYAAAHNQALSITNLPYVLTLNPDVILSSNYLSTIMKHLKKENQNLGSVAGKLFRINKIDNTSSTIDGMGIFMRKNRRQGLLYENKQSYEVPTKVFPIFGPDGAAALYKRKMLEDIAVFGEIFDTDFFMHKEDVDICWRSKLRGWNSVCIPDAKAYHIRMFRPGKRDLISPQMRITAIKNRYLLIIKNDSVSMVVKNLLSIMIYEIGIFMYILIKERKSLIAYKEVLLLLSKMLKKRKFIQNNRKINDIIMSNWFL